MHRVVSLRNVLPSFVLALGLLVSAPAWAAGLYIPESSAGALARGGEAVSLLDTAYALEFNPAGLTFGNGLDVRADINLTSPGETFQPAGQSVTASNTGGLSPGPAIMVSYRLPGILKQLGVGVGVWSPPGVLAYKFPDPRSFNCAQAMNPDTCSVNAATATPQRYNNISQSTLVVFPSIGLSWRPIPWVSIGGTLQYVISSVSLSTSQLGNSLVSSTNSTSGDVIANVKVNARPAVTGIAGIIISPIPDLVLSGSFTPTLPITSNGTLTSELGTTLSEFGASVTPAQPSANLYINLPPVVRAGLAYKWQRLAVGAEFVWEGWSTNKQFTLTTNAESFLPGQTVGTPIGSASQCPKGVSSPTGTCTAIVNNWKDAESYRLGVSYDFLRQQDSGFLLQGSVGGVYETNAIPSQYQSLPFVTGNLGGGSLGIAAGWRGFGVAVSAMIFAPQKFTVTNSATPYPIAMGSPPPGDIGNGTYTTNIWELGLGLFYHGLDGQG
jgi:hypothetical protein